MNMLRQAHAIDADDRFGASIDQCGRLHRVARQSGAAFERGPIRGAHRIGELFEAVRVLVNEIPVQHGTLRRRAGVVPCDQRFAHAHDGGHVAARFT